MGRPDVRLGGRGRQHGGVVPIDHIGTVTVLLSASELPARSNW